jgi:translation initiation factor 4E
MKPDTLPNNKTDSAKPTSTTNQHSDHPPTTTPALVLPSTSSSSSSSNQTTDPSSPAKKHTQQPSKTTGDPVQQPTTSTDQGAQQQQQELHPLQHSWTLYFDTRLSKRSSTSAGHATGGQAYEAGLQPIGTFQSVEQFCRFFNWTVIPSQMDMNSSVQLFKAHIKPMWEDPANSKVSALLLSFTYRSIYQNH